MTDFLLRACAYHHSEVPGVQLAPLAQRVPAARRLDLDHLRPELGEHARAERSGDQLAELDDLDALEGLATRYAHGRAVYRFPDSDIRPGEL